MGAYPTDHYRNDVRGHHRGNLLNICVIITVFAVYTTNTFLGKPNFDNQFLHCYLNDLFAMPLILAYTNLLIRWTGERSKVFSTPIRIGCLTIFCIVVWEGFAPMILAHSVRDMFDVVAYSSGSICYCLAVFLSDRWSLSHSGAGNLNAIKRRTHPCL